MEKKGANGMKTKQSDRYCKKKKREYYSKQLRDIPKGEEKDGGT